MFEPLDGLGNDLDMMHPEHRTRVVKISRPPMKRGYRCEARCLCGWISDEFDHYSPARLAGLVHEREAAESAEAASWEGEGGA